jgi:hypothetical protein
VDPGKRRGPSPEGDRPSSNDTAATTQAGGSSLVDFVPAYVAVMVDRFGTPRRRPYLNLHHASAAVQRARAQGRQAWIVLCELRPVQPDLDLDGGDQQ